MINSLTLAGTLPVKKEKVEKEHVVLRGKLVFKEKGLSPIKFYLEDKLGGNYQLVMFEDKPVSKDGSFLIEKGIIVKDILKQRIWSKLDSLHIKKEKDINYLLISFSNEELENQNHFQIIFLGLKTIFELEKNINGSIYAKLE